jgi:hypothetical protein
MFTSNQQPDYLDPSGKPKSKSQVPQVVAVYDSNNTAHAARDALLAAGIPRGVVHAIDRAAPAQAQQRAESRRQTLWAIIGSLFWPAEDPAMYNLAADPDHALIVLKPDSSTDLPRAIQILRACRPFYVFPALDESGAPVHA